MKAFFYQGFPNQLQAAHLEAIAGLEGWEVTLVVGGHVPEWRRNMGWSDQRHSLVHVSTVRDGTEAARFVCEAPADALHVFSGAGATPALREAFVRAIDCGARVAMMAEPGIGLGIGGMLRRVRERWRARRRGRELSFILAIGHVGVDWYISAGYPVDRVFPYAYFVPGPTATGTPLAPDAGREFRACFVGQLIERKGVDLLLRAVRKMNAKPWTLEVVGDGPERRRVEAEALRHDGPRIEVRGTMSHPEALERIQRADVLVLPSRWDGWGAVVNEALLRGVRVVCSDKCGAAVLIRSSKQGRVFRSGVERELRSTLQSLVEEGPSDARTRDELRTWAQCLQPAAGARYFAAIASVAGTGGNAPPPPWARE